MNDEKDGNVSVSDWFCTPQAQEEIRQPAENTTTFTRGAFGEISIAIHTPSIQTWRFLAIKSIVLKGTQNQWTMMPSSNKEETKLPRAVFNEICALRLLQPHPNIVELKAVYPMKDNSIGLAFAYSPTDLYTTLEWRRRTLLPLLSLPIIQAILHDLFSALQHCHSHGCLHLDVKPGNLLVSSQGIIQLCDFGLVQPCPKDSNACEHLDSNGLCTLFYRPPELLFGSQTATAAADVYSAGLVCGELVAGFPILRGGNVLGQLAATFEVLGTPTTETWPSVDQLPDYGKLNFAKKPRQPMETVLPRTKENPALLQLVDNLLTLDPSKRPSSEAVLQHAVFEDIEVDGSALQEALIPEELLEPILLSNSNNELSLASQKAVQLAKTRRTFLRSLSPWIESKNLGEMPSLQTRCKELCASMS